jgi:protein transport protein SEC31
VLLLSGCGVTLVVVQGVLGMSWCQQDHSLLLSCSKDGRTICWDVNTTDVVCELASHGHDNWNFDVQVREAGG